MQPHFEAHQQQQRVSTGHSLWEGLPLSMGTAMTGGFQCTCSLKSEAWSWKIGPDLKPSAGEQVLDYGSAAFSLGWSVKRRVLAVGGNSELRLYTV